MKKIGLLLTVILFSCSNNSLKTEKAQQLLQNEYPKYSEEKFIRDLYHISDFEYMGALKLEKAGLVTLKQSEKRSDFIELTPKANLEKKAHGYIAYSLKHSLGNIIGISEISKNKAEVIFEEVQNPTEIAIAGEWKVNSQIINKKATFTKYDSGWILDGIEK